MTLESNLDNNHKIRIVLADDHPLMRQALRMWIEKQQDLEIIAEASNGKEAVEIVTRLNPDVVIMDISMPKLNGLEATKIIKKACPSTAVLVLTVYTDEEHVSSLIEAGADGYITKTVSGEEIIHAIRALALGESLLPPNILSNAMNDTLYHPIPDLTKLNRLDARELTILKLAANGFSNKQIAVKQGLNLRSVKSTLTTLFLKLGVSSRTEAIANGLKTGIITIRDLEQ